MLGAGEVDARPGDVLVIVSHHRTFMAFNASDFIRRLERGTHLAVIAVDDVSEWQPRRVTALAASVAGSQQVWWYHDATHSAQASVLVSP